MNASLWIRLFNRLEKAVTRHIDAKGGTGFTDDADDALHAAHQRIMRDACIPDALREELVTTVTRVIAKDFGGRAHIWEHDRKLASMIADAILKGE